VKEALTVLALITSMLWSVLLFCMGAFIMAAEEPRYTGWHRWFGRFMILSGFGLMVAMIIVADQI
jgi:hypothetical protein